MGQDGTLYALPDSLREPTHREYDRPAWGDGPVFLRYFDRDDGYVIEVAGHRVSLPQAAADAAADDNLSDADPGLQQHNDRLYVSVPDTDVRAARGTVAGILRQLDPYLAERAQPSP